MGQYLRKGIAVFFEYDTPKIVHIRSKKVGIINRLIQLGIIAYVIGWAIVYKKGYQEFESVTSAVTTKLKGTVYTNLTNLNITGISGRVWDVADYVVPPQENGAFFVMTNMIVTPNQTNSYCDEDPDITDGLCETSADCPRGIPVLNGNGVRTGECVNSTQEPTKRTCQVYAWCPIELNQLPIPGKSLLNGSKHFTVLIKNSIEFPRFGVKRRNVVENIRNDSYLKSCRYNSVDETDRFCPVFTLETIVKEAGEDYDDMAVLGGLISIGITWDCNLDFSREYCVPLYSFRRLDDRDALIAKGWNFRFAHYYVEDGVDKRVLYKAYGIRFVFSVTGQAGKFSFVPMMLNIGSGLALLSIATVLCDVVVLYVLKYKDYYRKNKYLEVKGDDAYQAFENPVETDEEPEINQADSSVKNRKRVPPETRDNYGATDEQARP